MQVRAGLSPGIASCGMSLIEAALALPPEERLIWHQRIADFLLEVRAAGEAQATK